MLALSFFLAFVIFQHESNKIFIEVIFTIVGTIFALLFTFEIFYPRLYNTEKHRLVSYEECLKFYRDRHPSFFDKNNHKKNFKGMVNLKALRKRLEDILDKNHTNKKKLNRVIPEEIPIIVEYIPSRGYLEVNKENIIINLKNKVYNIPEEIRSLYEPVKDDLNKRFLMEGHFNKLNVRLESYREESNRLEVTLSKTTYYDTFITHFFADYWPYGTKKMTIREEVDHLLFKNDQLITFEESLLPNQLGVGGLIITKNGKTLLPTRNLRVATGSGTLDYSFAGSFDLVSFYRGTNSRLSPNNKSTINFDGDKLREAIIDQLKDEIALRNKKIKIEDKIRKIYILGIIRNLLWLGKPDFLVIVFTDEFLEDELKIIREEYKYFNDPIVDLGMDSGEEINDINDLLEDKNFERIINIILYEIYRRCNRRVKSSKTLLTLLCLLNEIKNPDKH